MKHHKVSMLLALTATAILAFTASASAAKYTSPTGTNYGIAKTIKTASGNMKLTGAFVTVECATSTIEGQVTSSGGSAVEVSLSRFDLNSCNFATTVQKAGTLAFVPIGTGNEVNSTIRSTGFEVDITTSLGTCVFTTSGTDIGTFTGGKTASLDLNGVIPRTAGNFACGSSTTWETTDTVVTPDELWFDS